MKVPVSDLLVDEYFERVVEGVSTANMFPARMSDCDFTPSQRETIRLARIYHRNAKKLAKLSNPAQPTPKKNPKVAVAAPKPAATKKPTKLQKLLLQQSGRCFYCGELLREEDASIDHLQPRSLGGPNAQQNCVACHKHQNAAFGNMELKHKIALLLKSAGSFKCARK